MSDLLFLLGPSGVGKSTVGRWLHDDLGLLHLEIDRAPDGIDLAGLRSEWDAFFYTPHSVASLVAALRRESERVGKVGAVMTFPGHLILEPAHLRAAHASRISVIALFGSETECLNAFRNREANNGRGLPDEHWHYFSPRSYECLSRAEYASLLLPAFRDGRHRSRVEIVDEIRRRMADN